MANLNILKGILLLVLMFTSAISSCEQPTKPPPDETEPYFKPGEYGGDPLEGTEHLYNMQLSPDGSKIALIRSRTPGSLLEPRDQLWILNADGTNPRLIGYNIGGADWSPDGGKLAITFMPGAPYTYIFTIRLDSMKATQWSGDENMFFSKATESNPRWFNDNQRLLISVWAKAYKQPYERGVYVIHTNDQTIEGPLVKIAAGAFLGNNEKYFIATKYLDQSDPLSGNYISYNLESQSWNWISDFPDDSLYKLVNQPKPNPQEDELIYTRYIDNAWQLFLLNSSGKEIKQLTKFGGENPTWNKNGNGIYFNRDTHKAPGARYIPFYYELATKQLQPLWSNLPDSVPQFPALSTQNPIDFRAIIQNNATSSN